MNGKIRILDKYEYDPRIDRLGKGGFGEVYKVRDIHLNKWRAIKIYKGEGSDYDVISEIQKMIDYSHPNIIRFFDARITEHIDPLHGLSTVQIGVMEYANAGTLADFWPKCRDSKIRKKLIKDILEGLYYFQQNNLIHRDLKPANILIHEAPKGIFTAKLADFGLSKEVSDLRTSSEVMGTIEYMAPEQLMKKKYGKDGRMQPNLDLWSFGVILYELFTKETPFGSRRAGDTNLDILRNIDDYQNGTIDTGLIPTPYSDIIQKCLIKHAEERTTDCGDLLDLWKVPKQKTKTVNPIYDLPAENINVRAEKVDDVKETEKRKDAKKGILWVLPLLLILIGGIGYWCNELIQREEYIENLIAQTPKGMVFVEGGSFMMGCIEGDKDCEEDEKPSHKVILSDFYMDKKEVTVGEFKAFIDATAYQTDAEKKGYSYVWTNKWKKKDGIYWLYNSEGKKHSSETYNDPVIHVSWNDATAYAKWAGKRLPTEAEWEYAAREGGKNNKWGATNSLEDLANYANYWEKGEKDEDGYEFTAPVGNYKPNQLGLYDMTGNVSEWCMDYYDKNYYKEKKYNDRFNGKKNAYRVFRGGSWDGGSTYCRVSNRYLNLSDDRSYFVGFRCVRTP